MKFIEFDVDFEECGEVEEVILHDMYGRHESVVLKRGAEYRKPTTLSQLEAENATLRELIKDLYADMWASGEWLEPYEQRMRELGIEVE